MFSYIKNHLTNPLFNFFLILLVISGFFISFLFLVSSGEYASAQDSKDALAIRVIPNPEHYSPLHWYQSQKFTGSPQSTVVDGYKAVRDGRTVYVNAANIEGATPTLYTNIYLISYNQDAEQETVDIFGRILSNWKFNTNYLTPGICSINNESAGNCDGTAGCWRFEGDLDDGSGNENHGDKEGTGVGSVKGVSGMAASFDGSDDHISVKGNSLFFGESDSFTLSAWFLRTGSSDTRPRIISKRGSTSNDWYDIFLHDPGGKYIATSICGDYSAGGGCGYITASWPVSNNVWYNVVSVRDVGADKVFLYVNGKLEGSVTDFSVGDVSDAVSDFKINGYGNQQANFKGYIDDVKIYDRALTQNEVSDLFYNGMKNCITDADCEGRGFCDSVKARITRDTNRLSDFADLEEDFENYFNNRGSYPKLGAGTYLSNASISTWPSWQQTLSSDLGISLPADPVNRLGGCAGYDPDTCWDETSKTFADPDTGNSIIDLPTDSYAYVYTAVDGGASYTLCSNMESGLVSVADGDCASNSLINQPPQILKVNLPPTVTGEEFMGYIEAYDPDGDILFWEINTPGGWSGWSGAPVLQDFGVKRQRTVYASQAGNVGSYNFTIKIWDGRGGVYTNNSADPDWSGDSAYTIDIVAAAACNDNDTDGYGIPGHISCLKGPEQDCDDNDGRRSPGTLEICDDGIDNDCDGYQDCNDFDCDYACPAVCGDGVCEVDKGECQTCDTGECTIALCCGNGDVDLILGENCDDGNTQNLDECDNACEKTYCGDSFIQNQPNNGDFIIEECDDGNTNDFDGCSVNCQIEVFSCSDHDCNGVCPPGCTADDDPDCSCGTDGSCCGRMCTYPVDTNNPNSNEDLDCLDSCGIPTAFCGGAICCDTAVEDCNNCSADCGICNFNVSCMNPPVSVIGWWSGNGYSLDYANNNPGTSIGAAYVNGYVEQAFDFNGADDDYVEIPEAGVENLDGFTEMSIEAWINPETQIWTDGFGAKPHGVIVSKADETLANGVSYIFKLYNDGKLEFQVKESDSPNVGAGFKTSQAVPTGTWTHIVAVWRGGDNTEIWINGVQAGGTKMVFQGIPTTMLDSNVDVNIGRVESYGGAFTGAGGYFEGLIDEVTIYNDALAQSQIESIHNAQTEGKCSPMCIFPFNFPCILF